MDSLSIQVCCGNYKQKILKIRQTIHNDMCNRHAIRTILIAYFRTFPTADKLRFIDRFNVLLWNRSALQYIANESLCFERLPSLKLQKLPIISDFGRTSTTLIFFSDNLSAIHVHGSIHVDSEAVSGGTRKPVWFWRVTFKSSPISQSEKCMNISKKKIIFCVSLGPKNVRYPTTWSFSWSDNSINILRGEGAKAYSSFCLKQRSVKKRIVIATSSVVEQLKNH